ncbi:protein ABCI12, chloroplastic-like isoform X1 [Euphorbia lathyris]|uniref:protein ABCI12, chloroplastic-like isoform X1 n=1 Tax=Euphorbia lathyris TaxID=212925 RepID=UPI0033143A8D
MNSSTHNAIISGHPHFKTLLPSPKFYSVTPKCLLYSTPCVSLLRTPTNLKPISFKTRASASVDSTADPQNWINRLPTTGFAADMILRLIAGVTSSPIVQFISSPTLELNWFSFGDALWIGSVPCSSVNMGSPEASLDGP